MQLAKTYSFSSAQKIGVRALKSPKRLVEASFARDAQLKGREFQVLVEVQATKLVMPSSSQVCAHASSRSSNSTSH